MSTLTPSTRRATDLDFVLPAALEATEPPEAHGSGREDVRLMVAHRRSGELIDTRFTSLPDQLTADDLLIVNTSGTLPAAIDATLPSGEAVVVHLSTHLGANVWVVELRRPSAGATVPWHGDATDTTLRLPAGARLSVHSGFLTSSRLWMARVDVLGGDVLAYLAQHGRPIRYGYVPHGWPIEAYQTVFATEPGSAEMPSASRPFTPELIARLVSAGVGFAPVLLHTGVASLESHEPPYPEYFRVPAVTARRVKETRAAGGRVIAIGTTAVRAIESATAPDSCEPRATRGWTDLVITPERGVRVVDGLLTGWHEPQASHLHMLEAIAGRELLESSYEHALAERYRWHEFGDLHLIVP